MKKITKFSKVIVSLMMVFALCATTMMVPMTSVDAASKKVTLIKGVSIPTPGGYTKLKKESGVCIWMSNLVSDKDASMIFAAAQKNSSLKGVKISNKTYANVLKNMLKNDSSLKNMGIKNVKTKVIKTKSGKALSFSGNVTSQGKKMYIKGFMIIKNSKVILVENVYTSGLKSLASKSMKTIQNGIVVK